MDRKQLVAALLEAGLPAQSFQIPGIHTHDPMPTDFWYLQPGAGGDWEVGSYDRGFTIRGRFSSESEAAAWMYRVLTGRAAP